MLDYHRLRRHAAYQVVDEANVYVYSETQSFHFGGKAYAHLLPLLRGGLSLRALLAAPPAGLTMVEVLYAVERLKAQQLITHIRAAAREDGDGAGDGAADGAGEAPDAVFWDSLGQDPELARQRRRQAPVALLDLSAGAASAALMRALAQQDISVRDGANPALQIVLVDDYLDPRLEQINRLNHERGTPWLLAKPAGALMWVGPLMAGADSACWRCMQHRLLYRRKLGAYLRQHAGGGQDRSAGDIHFSCATQLALASICAEVVKFLVLQGSPELAAHVPSLHHVVTIDALTYRHERHEVIRRPQCACCGEPGLVAAQQSRAPVLDTSAPLHSREGGLRVRSAQQVSDALQRHVGPLIGLVGLTRTITQAGDVHGITASVAAEHNFSLIDAGASFLQERIRSCAGGKGTTLIQAQASALCESIERYSGMYQGDEKRIAAAFADLPNAIAPNDCLLFSPDQYRDRERINATASRIGAVAQPFDPAQSIDWTPLWSLSHHQFYYLPTSYCFYGYALQHDCHIAKADSNGCAAGSSLAEAVLQGFLELVERDAAALWWYNRAIRPGVDWRSFDEPYLQAVAQFYAGCGRSFWVLDITSDLGIPCFAALCARPGAAAEEITFAFGAHLDARIALLRAVTELNQIMPNLANDEATSLQSLGGEALRWWREARLAGHAYLSPGPAAARQAASYAPASHLTLGQALQACLDCAARHGLNVLMLDQSRPDTGLAVVRVVIPSLRHFWPRFAPGRLFAGADAVRTEAELNPYPIFI